MKSIVRVHKSQPVVKTKVVELEVGGRIGRWFWNHNWGALTTPWPFVTTILYWSAEDAPDGNVDPFIRVHEWTHVQQIEETLFFGLFWARYLWASMKNITWKDIRAVGISQALLDAYYQNKYEAEAYAVEDIAENNGLPDWAK